VEEMNEKRPSGDKHCSASSIDMTQLSDQEKLNKVYDRMIWMFGLNGDLGEHGKLVQQVSELQASVESLQRPAPWSDGKKILVGAICTLSGIIILAMFSWVISDVRQRDRQDMALTQLGADIASEKASIQSLSNDQKRTQDMLIQHEMADSERQKNKK